MTTRSLTTPLAWLARLWWRDLPLAVRGERWAAWWLRVRRYRLLHRNLRAHGAEADLIMLDPDGRTVVIVEVKTRRDDALWPEAALGPVKQRSMERIADYLAGHGARQTAPMRFDAVVIVWPHGGVPAVRHYRDVWGG